MARIIVVDDSLIIRTALSNLVKAAGHELITVGKDGNEATALYKEHQPDLMLLDLTMPNKGGRETLAEICGEFPNAKIIIFSSLDGETVKKECLDLGAKSFLHKAVNFNDPEQKTLLQNEIEKVLAE